MVIVTNNEIMEAAKELGEALRDCEECRAVEEALEALSVDEEANRILAEAQVMHISMPESLMPGKKPAKNETGEQEQLDAKMRSNPIIMNHFEAQKKLDVLIGQLNDEISRILGIDFRTRSPKKSGCH